MIKTILWDIDGTILNFLAAEKAALRTCFKDHDLGECTDEMIARYSKINRSFWERLERGEISKKEVLEGRFQTFFKEEGLPDVAESFNAEYQLRLGDTCIFMDNAYELIQKLKDQGYRQYIVTNGTKTAQERKLKNSNLNELVDGVFISEEVGTEKPGINFFKTVFAKIGPCDPHQTMIVGDSLTSDMKGGNNAGILCCWYNPAHQEKNSEDVRIDYEIDHLWKIMDILEKEQNA